MLKMFMIGLLVGFIRGLLQWVSERETRDRQSLQGA